MTKPIRAGHHVPTLCVACARVIDDKGQGTCTSFPTGIPADIGMFGASHLSSWLGEEPFLLDRSKRHLFDLWAAQHQEEVAAHE